MTKAVEIEIARTGRHEDKRGVPVELSVSDLQEIAGSYNPKNFQAPLIVSHETHGVPDNQVFTQKFSFGTPDRLKVVGDRLKAVFSHVAPSFSQWVKDKHLLAISPSFYGPQSPRNPTPGKRHLRHIAALGSESPAIKGLEPLSEAFSFAEAEADEFCLEFAEPEITEFSYGDRYVPQLFQRLRDYMVAEKGLEEAEKVLPADLLMAATEAAVEPDNVWLDSAVTRLMERLDALEERLNRLTDNPMFSEGGAMALKPYLAQLLKAQMASVNKDAAAVAQEAGINNFSEILDGSVEATDEQLAQIVQVVAAPVSFAEPSDRERELERKLAEYERQTVTSFVEGHVERGAVLPGEKTGLVELLMLADQAQPVEFSEGEQTQALKLGESLRQFLKRLEPVIEFSEIAKGSGDESVEALDFAEPAGYEVNPQKKVLLQKAKAYQSQHPEVDLIAAYKAVGGQ